MLLSLDAQIYCDACGRQFIVEIDGEAACQAESLDMMLTAGFACEVKGGGFGAFHGRTMWCPTCATMAEDAGRMGEAGRETPEELLADARAKRDHYVAELEKINESAA